MLQSTFIMLKGIGPFLERQLWEHQIITWEAFLQASNLPGISPQRKPLHDAHLVEASSRLNAGESRYFGKWLKHRDHWRLYDAFKSNTVYLDIETTGDPPDSGEVTVVGLYREGRMTTLVRGETLTSDRLNQELAECDLLVTFFGSVFDIPYLRAKFPDLVCDHPHFDLCFGARRLGLRGGLKRIEAGVGIERPSDLQDLDGWAAVHLWAQWLSGRPTALERLIRYNEADTRNLEPLADLLFTQLAERYGPPHGRPPDPLVKDQAHVS